MGLLAAIVLAGALVQGCSDNNGRITGTESTVTGDGIGGPGSISMFVQVTVNPASVCPGRRASVLTIVTNANGIPLPGRNVQLTASLGQLDASFGQTDSNGLFSTTILVPAATAPLATGAVTAIVQGVTSTGGTFAAGTPPC